VLGTAEDVGGVLGNAEGLEEIEGRKDG